MESWARGIDIMMEGCREYGMPEPLIEEDQGGIRVTFLKDVYTEDYLKTLDLNELQVKAIMYVKENGEITNLDYRELTGVSDRTALRDLNELVQQQILKREGTTGKGTSYTLS